MEFSYSTKLDGYDWNSVHEKLEQLAKKNGMTSATEQLRGHLYNYMEAISLKQEAGGDGEVFGEGGKPERSDEDHGVHRRSP